MTNPSLPFHHQGPPKHWKANVYITKDLTDELMNLVTSGLLQHRRKDPRQRIDLCKSLIFISTAVERDCSNFVALAGNSVFLPDFLRPAKAKNV
jgi:hypothetical protein